MLTTPTAASCGEIFSIINSIVTRWSTIGYKYKGRLIRLNSNKILDYEDSKRLTLGHIIRAIILLIYTNIALLRYYLKIRPDFIFVHGIRRFYYIILLILLKHPNVIYVRHNYNYFFTRFPKLSNALLRAFTSKVICVSSGMEKQAIEILRFKPSQVQVINNGIDVDNINELSQEAVTDFEFDRTLRYVVTIGRACKEKGLDHLLRIANDLRYDTAFSDVRFIILGGSGHGRELLEKHIEELGLKNHIKLFEFKMNPFKYIKNATVFFLPSESEGFPYSILEAMACGIPVVSTDCLTGPREILDNQTDYFHLQTSGFYQGKYGILTPVMLTVTDLHLPLSPTEKSNELALQLVLSDKHLQKNLKIAGKVRVNDFTVTKTIEGYYNFITGIKS